MNTILILLLVLAQDAPSAPRVIVRTIDGKTINAQMGQCALDRGALLRLDNGRSVRMACDDIDEIAWPGARDLPQSGSWIVQTWDGDRLACSIDNGDEDQFSVRHATLGDIQFDLDRLKSISRAEETLRRFGLSDEDAVTLAGGNQLTGLVIGVNKEGVVLAQSEQRRKIVWKDVESVRTAAPPTKEHGLQCLVYLADESRLLATALSVSEGGFSVALARGTNLVIPVETIRKIEMLGRRRTWLSELTPTRYASKPYLGAPFAWQADQNVRCDVLSINGQTFTRGLGLQSACSMSWKLDGKFDRLTLQCGIDDSAGPWADADLTIRVDGRVVAGPHNLRFKLPAKLVEVKLNGAKELTIEVGFGKNGDVQDFVDLGAAALIRR